MITFEKLSWSNMFSYGSDNTMLLDNEPITQLIGLNGHGKSSIPLILEEVLFNKNSKGIKKGDIVNRNLDTNKYNAALTFKVYDDNYTIEVNRTGASQKVKLLKNGSDISSHTATDTFKQIEQVIGLDFKTFSQIVYQNSSSSLQFLTATDTARKNFLIDLLSLERYVKIFEEVKKVHKSVADSLLATQTKLNTVKTWIEKNTGKVDSYLIKREIPTINSDDTDRAAELAGTLQTIEATNKLIIKNNEYIKILDSIDKDELRKTYETIDYKDKQELLAKVKVVRDQAEATIKKHKGIHEGTCPTCYQSIDISVINKIIEEAQDSFDAHSHDYKWLTEEIKKAKEQNLKASEHQKLVEQRASDS